MAIREILAGVPTVAALFMSANCYADPVIFGAISAAEARYRTAEVVYANLMQSFDQGLAYRQTSTFTMSGHSGTPVPNPGGTTQRMTEALRSFNSTFDRTGDVITASGRDEILTSMGHETGSQVVTNLKNVLAQKAQWIAGWIERAPRNPTDRAAYYERAAARIADEIAQETIRPIGAQLDTNFTAFRANPKPPSLVELVGGPRGLLTDEQVLTRINQPNSPFHGVGDYVAKNGKIKNAADLVKLMEKGHTQAFGVGGDLARMFPEVAPHRVPVSMYTVSDMRPEYVRRFRRDVTHFNPETSPSRITFGRNGAIQLDVPPRTGGSLAGTVAREERFVQLTLAEQRGIVKGLAEAGMGEAGVVSKGATVFRVGGRILFWVGAALMVYDGVSGSVQAVRHGDPLANFVADNSPQFMAGAVRNTVAVASGFTKGVLNGMAAPATALYQYTFPGIFTALGGLEALERERQQRVNEVVQVQAKVALAEGKRLYGQDYQLPQSYIQELRTAAEAKQSAGGGN